MELPQEDTAALAAISGGWEWGSLLDFPIDDDSGLLSWGSSPLENQRSGTDTSFSPSDPGAPAADRVRKRDTRLVCPNFMAGRIPCACPEVDEKEAAAAMNVRKRTKTAVRCQVPDCEADISELKGYHRRHRVCLRCAYAPTVVLDGQMHRYCQQCGKFHLLPDFDEGKRSCRRKLERHNHRRRRKSLDSKSMPETSQPMERRKSDMCLVDAPSGVEEAGKGKILRESCGDDSVHINEQEMDRNRMLETEDVLGSPVSAVAIQVNNCTLDVPNEVIPSTTSSGVVKESIREHSISEMSSSFYENKTAYSSMCPTGRVSFKLYDWNPAEFPRRLRHQIFHWLANMPVELEGYIRPGCTILTAFIAMPQKMRKRLAEGDTALANDLINAPESMLAGRGNMLIYLNDSIFQFLKGENSLKRIMPRIKAPRLHYAYPICFEAGKPMEFIVCGENLVQSRFRFLVSFGGRYLQCKHCQVIPIVEATSDSETNVNNRSTRYHEMLKVHISHTEPKTYGPAFIEVENKSGLSNFIPVIFADPQMCSDFEMVQKVLCEFAPGQGNGPHFGNYGAFRDPYAFSGEKHESISELLLDIAWLISEPKKDERHTTFHVQRLNGLLDFLIRNGIVNILKKILKLPKVLMLLEKLQNLRDTEANVDLDTFHVYIKSARELIAHVTGVAEGDSLPLDLDDRTHENSEDFVPKYIFQAVECSREQNFSQETPTRENNRDIVSTRPETASSLTEPGDQQTPLLVKDFVMRVHEYSHEAEGLDRAMQGQSRYLSSTYLRTRRPLVMMVAAIAFCCGLCIILKHPHKVLEFSHAVRKCLLGVH